MCVNKRFSSDKSKKNAAKMREEEEKKLHIAMYPWFAMGHLTSFLHISNKLAERGHRISFYIPTKTQSKLVSFNLHPHLISFVPIHVPHVDGLPPGAETTADVPYHLISFLMTAMDLTRPQLEASLQNLKPQIIFFDFTHWLPEAARRFGIKSLHYCTVSPATHGYLISPDRRLDEFPLTEADLMQPLPGFPSSCIKLRAHEARRLAKATVMEFGNGITFTKRQKIGLDDSDAIVFKTSREMEGVYADYVAEKWGKAVILAGPVVPERPKSVLEGETAAFLSRFEKGSVVYCAFGSECVLVKEQFQQLVLGLELTGRPFLVALKPPAGSETVESALPDGFKKRVGSRGLVHGGWVQQQLILSHGSVGCFVTHCGCGSLLEGMVNECQLVLVPNVGDQFINARIMSDDLKVGVEVEKGDEDGFFTKEGVCRAVEAVMVKESHVGKEVRANHKKWRDFLLSKGLEDSYIDDFIKKLHALITAT
ncbi:cyanidin 3-O-galactoside 2''-O-xylosyltransferase FGGT1-like [Humulus lupulus]|uniref:cyanidin 3-O-galactoside 2''-O-xylosyltransferase FGGT1-like n=1 Tax=Humulus lupulus TaxID=3486 RepID=UPI002B4179BA|nr:cyanidin 3-O-galactoside 2''-O-xylosyltransferase FGGT1-like [Humulus lupulus]